MISAVVICLLFGCLFGWATVDEIFHTDRKNRAKMIRACLIITVLSFGAGLLLAYALYQNRHDPRIWGGGSNGCYFNVC